MLFFISKKDIFNENEVYESDNYFTISERVNELLDVGVKINRMTIYRVEIIGESDEILPRVYRTNKIKIIRKISLKKTLEYDGEFRRYYYRLEQQKERINRKYKKALIIALMPLAYVIVVYVIIPLLFL